MKFNLLKIIPLFLLILTGVFVVGAQSGHHRNDSQNEQQTKDKSGEIQTNDRPLEITRKDSPDVHIFEGCFTRYGMMHAETTVRVTFDKTGVISKTEIVKESGCEEFDDESVRVARLIEFNPARKDGEPVTVTKLVLYPAGVR